MSGLWPVQVKVYLNEGPDNFFGFHNQFANEPRLRLAAEFEVQEEDCDGQPVLPMIFDQLNIGGDLIPAKPWCERYRAERNRSLSVGDVVQLDERFYACASMSWDDVSQFEVDEAIADFDRLGKFDGRSLPGLHPGGGQ